MFVSLVEYNFEFFVCKVFKGQVLVRFVEWLNILIEEIVVVGDSLNDKLMLEVVGKGVVMGNVWEDIKLMVDVVILINDEYGVVYMIKNLLQVYMLY